MESQEHPAHVKLPERRDLLELRERPVPSGQQVKMEQAVGDNTNMVQITIFQEKALQVLLENLDQLEKTDNPVDQAQLDLLDQMEALEAMQLVSFVQM